MSEPDLIAEEEALIERLAIKVYQRISVGHDVAAIQKDLQNLDFSERQVAAIMAQGKDRYRGYTEFLRNSNVDYGKHSLWAGLALLGLGLLCYFALGTPDFGRGRGILFAAFLFGAGAVVYGLWQIGTATPEGRRTDLD